MRDDTGDHAVELEDGCDFHEKGREVGSGGLAWARANAGDLDLVRPADEQRGLVLPVQVAFEEVCARAVCGAVDEGNPALGVRVVDLHALLVANRRV